MHAEEIIEFIQKLGVRTIGFNLLTRLKEPSKFEVPDPKQLAHHLFGAYLKAKELHMFEDRIDNRRANYFFKEIFHIIRLPSFWSTTIFFANRNSRTMPRVLSVGEISNSNQRGFENSRRTIISQMAGNRHAKK